MKRRELGKLRFLDFEKGHIQETRICQLCK